jgi:hypothetical protein
MADIRILLTDKAIAQLPTPKDGWSLARDTELKGFFVVVGQRKRTFTIQGDLRQNGKRASSVRVSIGDTSEMSTRTARATAKEYLAQISKGKHPKAVKEEVQQADTGEKVPNSMPAAEITLWEAWQRYLEAHLIRKVRSEKTISAYRDHVERVLMDWLDTPLRELGMDPARVAKKHDETTKTNGSWRRQTASRKTSSIDLANDHHGAVYPQSHHS